MASANSTLTERLAVAVGDNSKINTICRDIASEIQSGHVKLFMSVEQLGPYITNKDVSVRESGVRILSTILSLLPKDFLNENELQFIIAFYCDRLKDHHNVIPPVLFGILSIVEMKHLPENGPELLLRTMMEHVRCQSQLLSDRNTIFKILKTLLENRKEALKLMGFDFVYGVISSIDGERDPRNLMLLFNMLPSFIKEFPLGHLTEEMFEVLSCYFPIEYNPLGSENLNLTREDLADALAPCLCAIPQFAEFCIPLISDKLLSDVQVAKLDSLNLLCRGVSTFGVKYLKDHLNELWSILRKEIIPGDNAEVLKVALKAITILINTISANENVRQSFIDKILKDINLSLCDVQLTLFKPAERLLEVIAKTNKESCVQVLRTIVPLCLGQYNTKTSLNDKVLITNTLNVFIKICCGNDLCIKDIPELTWTDIPQLYLNELTVQSAELKGKIINGLMIQKEHLNTCHRSVLYNCICNEIEYGSEELKNTCLTCLLEFATTYSEEILKLVKERLWIDKDGVSIKILTRRLEAVSTVAIKHDLGIEILPRIVAMATADDSEICLTALMCLQKLVAKKHIDFDIQHFLYYNCNIIHEFTALNIGISSQKLIHMSNICQSIVRSVSIEEQRTIVNKYSVVLQNMSEVSVQNMPNAIIIMSLFIPLHRNVHFNIDENVIETLYNIAINNSSKDMRLISCKLLSVLINKTDNEEYFKKILTSIRKRVYENLASDIDIELKQATVTLTFWLAKAVITKGSFNTEEFLEFVCSILRDNQIGQYVAQEYKTLVSTTDDALTCENHCNIKIFYKQRIFQHLIQQNHSFKNSSRQNYLIALMHLLEEVPIELLQMQLTELVPVLIEALSLNNRHLILSILTTLKILLDTKHIVFSNHMQSFIPRLLGLTTYKTMDVRIAALDCLTSYSNYPTALINIYKSDVIDGLAMAIDDRKRLVRQAAVKARTRWFLVGAPGGVD